MNVAGSHAEKLLATEAAAPGSVSQAAAEAMSTMGLKRETFTTSRLLDFFSEKELIAQAILPKPLLERW